MTGSALDVVRLREVLRSAAGRPVSDVLTGIVTVMLEQLPAPNAAVARLEAILDGATELFDD